MKNNFQATLNKEKNPGHTLHWRILFKAMNTFKHKIVEGLFIQRTNVLSPNSSPWEEFTPCVLLSDDRTSVSKTFVLFTLELLTILAFSIYYS